MAFSACGAEGIVAALQISIDSDVTMIGPAVKKKNGHRRIRKGKSAKTLPAKVEKIIPPAYPGDAEKAEVAVEGADDLYRELRVENKLSSDSGEEVALKPGAQVEVTIEADKKDTHRKSSGSSESA